MPRARRPKPPFALACEAALAAAAFFAPLALGSAPQWTLWPLAALSSLALAFALLSARSEGRPFHLPLLALVPLLAATVCALQLLPLPSAVAKLFSPEAAELREFALAPLGLDGARPVSLEPAATWRELSKHLCYAALLASAAYLCRSRMARRRIASTLALSGLAVALIGFGHELFGASKLFGFHAFQAQPPFLSTFGNPNHLAGFLTLTATLSLGLAIRAEQRPRSFSFGGVFLLSGAAVLLSLSRGGIAFFVAAQLALAAVLLWGRLARQAAERAMEWEGAPPAARKAPGWIRLGLAPLLALWAVLATGGYIAYDKIAAELATADSMEELKGSKVDLWPMMARGAAAYSRMGMGRGAFELGFTRHQDKTPESSFTHAENLVLQLWSELGLPALIGLIALAAFAAFKTARRREWTPVDFAAAVGVSALLLHDLFDFSLELPATASAACLALGLLCREEGGSPVGLPLPPRASVPAAFLAALAMLGPLWLGRHSYLDAERRLALFYQSASSPSEVRRAALPLIDRHPADWVLYGILGAAHAFKEPADPREALAFANRTLFLRPLDAQSHRTAARSLLILGGRSQALLEYRLAYQASAPLRDSLLGESASVAKGLSELRSLVPEEPAALVHLSGLLRSQGRREEDGALLQWAVGELFSHPDADALWLELATFRLEGKEPELSLAALGKVRRDSPRHFRAALLRAQVLAAAGRRAEAVSSLEEEARVSPGKAEVWLALAAHQLAAGQPRRARETLERASPFVTSSWQRADLFTLEAQAFQAEGLPMKAVQSYQSAARLRPESPHLHYAAARLFEQMSKPTEAIREVREGERLEGKPGSQSEWVARLESTLRALELRRLEQDAARAEPAPE
ncbi:MAG: tetratricopeptide repeat protein [Myxococcales bacterium]|nr:tetratricopeptide repeat protein [Myxococcales bacterium]